MAGKHRKATPAPKSWSRTGKRGAQASTTTRGATQIARGALKSGVPYAKTAAHADHRGGAKVRITQYTRGAATVGGRIADARIRSVYSTRTARMVQKGYTVMPPGWRMGR